jgi:hypothetical protein
MKITIDRPTHSDKPPTSRRPTREEEVRQVVEEYIRDQREILKTLRRFLN